MNGPETNLSEKYEPPVIEGYFLRLRPVRLEDASYIYARRTDPSYNQFLSPTIGTVMDQEVWLENYIEREANRQEIYYIIERIDDLLPCGTVRLYSIKSDQFTWGSWILDQNKTHKAALESALLIYDLGFARLGCERAIFEVRQDNYRTLAFHRRFGAQYKKHDILNIYFEYTRSQFNVDRNGHIAIIEKGFTA